MNASTLRFENLISDDWRYDSTFGELKIKEHFIYAISSFDKKTSRLMNRKWGIRVIPYNNNKTLLIKEVSSLELKDSSLINPSSFLNISSKDIPADAPEAITFYITRNEKKEYFSVWLINEKKLIVTAEDGVKRVNLIMESFSSFFDNPAIVKERNDELKAIHEEIRHFKIFSIGGDPEFEVIQTNNGNKNLPPSIVNANYIQITSTTATTVVGADGSGNQVELRPETVTFDDKTNPEEVADAMVANSAEAFSKYAAAYTPTLSSYGQKYFLGHHIHIGSVFKINPPALNKKLIKALDILVGEPLGSLSSEVRVASRFGKLGDAEEKAYGFEYRTPSAVWSHPELAKKIFTVVVRLIQKIATDGIAIKKTETTSTFLKTLGFTDDYIAAYNETIKRFVAPEKRVDTLGNWAVRKTYPAVSWKFPFDVRNMLLAANSDLNLVFLVGNSDKFILCTNKNKTSFIGDAERLSSKYNTGFKFYSDSENIDLNTFLEIREISNSCRIVLVSSQNSTNSDNNSADDQAVVSPTSSTAANFPIEGITQIIIPNTMSKSFYSELLTLCNNESRRN